jgi:hypothetical protein
MPELPVGENRIVGRLTGGDLDDLTPAQTAGMLEPYASLAPLWDGLSIETGADQGTTNPLGYADMFAVDITDNPTNRNIDALVVASNPLDDSDFGVAGFTVYAEAGYAFAQTKLQSVVDGVEDGRVLGYSEPGNAYLEVDCGAGQSGPALTVHTHAGSPVFTVGPTGAIIRCNGVAVPITGVPVTAAGVHAALVSLGLITT